MTSEEQYKSAAKLIAKELFNQDNVTRQETFQNHLNLFRNSINAELQELLNKAAEEEKKKKQKLPARNR